MGTIGSLCHKKVPLTSLEPTFVLCHGSATIITWSPSCCPIRLNHSLHRPTFLPTGNGKVRWLTPSFQEHAVEVVNITFFYIIVT